MSDPDDSGGKKGKAAPLVPHKSWQEIDEGWSTGDGTPSFPPGHHQAGQPPASVEKSVAAPGPGGVTDTLSEPLSPLPMLESAEDAEDGLFPPDDQPTMVDQSPLIAAGQVELAEDDTPIALALPQVPAPRGPGPAGPGQNRIVARRDEAQRGPDRRRSGLPTQPGRNLAPERAPGRPSEAEPAPLQAIRTAARTMIGLGPGERGEARASNAAAPAPVREASEARPEAAQPEPIDDPTPISPPVDEPDPSLDEACRTDPEAEVPPLPEDEEEPPAPAPAPQLAATAVAPPREAPSAAAPPAPPRRRTPQPETPAALRSEAAARSQAPNRRPASTGSGPSTPLLVILWVLALASVATAAALYLLR